VHEDQRDFPGAADLIEELNPIYVRHCHVVSLQKTDDPVFIRKALIPKAANLLHKRSRGWMLLVQSQDSRLPPQAGPRPVRGLSNLVRSRSRWDPRAKAFPSI
jgi:hypothetical protein